MSRTLPLLCIGGLIWSASTAMAHPGHGQVGSGHDVAHYLTDPLHLTGAVVAAVAMLAVVAVWRVGRESRQVS